MRNENSSNSEQVLVSKVPIAINLRKKPNGTKRKQTKITKQCGTLVGADARTSDQYSPASGPRYF